MDPGIDGLDTYKKILELHPDQKAIVASGYSHDPVMANFQEYGFAAAIMKPFRGQELTQIVQKVLG